MWCKLANWYFARPTLRLAQHVELVVQPGYKSRTVRTVTQVAGSGANAGAIVNCCSSNCRSASSYWKSSQTRWYAQSLSPREERKP